jgi:hypothetical protein
MKMRKILSAVLAVSTFLIAVSSNSVKAAGAAAVSKTGAAKCAVPPFKIAFAGANSVFVGKVRKVAQNGRGKTFTFQVEKYWKGSKSKKTEVTVFETTRYQAFYEAGKRYLVFAAADDEGNLTDGRCSRSTGIADADADLKALGKAKKPR